MQKCQEKEWAAMDRREFFEYGLAAGAALYAASWFDWFEPAAAQSAAALPDLVAVKNGEPAAMFDKAIEAFGGMSNFVQKGQIVVVKPNIGWNRGPEKAANTNPLLVKRIVEHCLDAGAKKVSVFDHGVDNSDQTYKTSGIAEAAKAGGAIVVPGADAKYYQKVTIPGAEKLKETKVHEALLEADVFINVPILKHHGSSQLTIAMKNLMGVVWDRGEYHWKGLHECIAEFCLYRKPNLNIVDAYQVTMANGPQSARESDLSLQKTLLLSQDIVAIDAAAAKIFGIEPEKIRHIKLGHDKKLGNMNLDALNIKRIVL